MSSITEPHSETPTRTSPAQASRSTSWLPVALLLLGAGWGSQQFTPMLLVYHRALHLGTATLEALFGFYALGLIPGLLIAGALSDGRGRRVAVIPAAALSLLGSAVLLVAGHSVVLLYTSRLLTGFSTGAIFSAGTAWLRELSRPPLGRAGEETTARRTTVAMTLGFGLGPLTAGMLAQWVALPRVVPYIPHVVLMVLVLAWIWRAPETVARDVRAHAGATLRRSLPLTRTRSFRSLIGPLAPWVFAGPAIAFALLPTVVGTQHARDGIALTAAVTTLCALAGVVVQPFARRLYRGSAGTRPAAIGLLTVALGLALSAITADARATWLLVPTEIVLGGAYGLCLVAGLIEVQRLADQNAQAGLTAIFYSLAYLGFAFPYLLALAAPLASYATLLGIVALLVLVTARFVSGQGVRAPGRKPADVPLS